MNLARLDDTISEIHQLQKKQFAFEDEADLRQYYSQCLSILKRKYFSCKDIKSHINCFNILFAREGYLYESNNTKLGSTGYKIVNNQKKKYLEYFKQAEKLVEEGSAISISILCIKRKLDGIRLFKDRDSTNDLNYVECDLFKLFGNYKTKALAEKNPVDFLTFIDSMKIYRDPGFKNFATKCGVEQSINAGFGLVKMLALYFHLAVQNNEEQFNLYFLRPKYDLKEFNGILLVNTSQELTKEQLIEINLLLKEVFLLPAISRAHQLSKYKEWQSIIEETSHALSTSFGSLESSANHLYQIYFNKSFESGSALVENEYEKMIAEITYLRELSTLELRIMETGQHGENSSYLSDARKKDIEKKWFSVRDTLIDLLTRVIPSFAYMGISAAKRKLLFNKAIPKLRADIQALPRMKVYAVPVAFKVLVIDLLKNMIYFSDDHNPVIHIGLKSEGTRAFLSFSNNTVISKPAYELFTTGKEGSGHYFKYKAGIRNMKRVLNWPLFSEEMWHLKLPPYNMLLKEAKTEMSLIIPKTCHRYEKR